MHIELTYPQIGLASRALFFDAYSAFLLQDGESAIARDCAQRDHSLRLDHRIMQLVPLNIGVFYECTRQKHLWKACGREIMPYQWLEVG